MEQTTKNKSFTQIACVLCLFAIGICICPGFRIGRRRTYPSPECSHSRISPKQTMLFGCALMQISHYTRAFCFVLHRWCWLMLWRGKNEYGFFPPINSGFALASLDQIKRYLKRWTVMKKNRTRRMPSAVNHNETIMTMGNERYMHTVPARHWF